MIIRQDDHLCCRLPNGHQWRVETIKMPQTNSVVSDGFA